MLNAQKITNPPFKNELFFGTIRIFNNKLNITIIIIHLQGIYLIKTIYKQYILCIAADDLENLQ